jgi:hypothetical protein
MEQRIKKIKDDLANPAISGLFNDKGAFINTQLQILETNLQNIERSVQIIEKTIQDKINQAAPPGGPALLGGYNKSTTPSIYHDAHPASIVPQAGGHKQYFGLEDYLNKLTA